MTANPRADYHDLDTSGIHGTNTTREQRAAAMRFLASQASDVDDLRYLLAVTGLDPAELTHQPEQELTA